MALKWPEGKDIEVRYDVPLAGLTTFRIGGVARTVLLPRTVSGMERCLKRFEQREKSIYCIGRGSNLLVSDKGLDAVLSPALLCGIEINEKSDSVTLTAQAGAGLRQLVALSARAGLKGLESLAGIPASVGGALFMNAGAGGLSFCDIVSEVLLVSPDGCGWLAVSGLGASYRSGGVPQGSFVAAVRIELEKSGPGEVRSKISEVMKRRAASQPIGAATAGCVFRNFADVPAGLLIDRCGLKGLSRGDAVVSPVHANFIVNRGNATFSDVMGLIDMVRERVNHETGRLLEVEIKILV